MKLRKLLHIFISLKDDILRKYFIAFFTFHILPNVIEFRQRLYLINTLSQYLNRQ